MHIGLRREKGFHMFRSNAKAAESIQDAPLLRALVLTEELPTAQIGVIEGAAAACRIDARLFQKPIDLMRALAAHGADLVLLSAEVARASEVCAAVRRFAGQAVVIGLTQRVDGLSFGEFTGWGGDDLIQGDSQRGLGARLRSIRTDLSRSQGERKSPREREDGRFLVVAPPASEVAASAAVIEQTGHHAVVVATLEEAVTRLGVGRNVRVVIDARMTGALGFVDHALAQSACSGIVLACPPQQVGQMIKRYEGSSDRLIVLDCFSPADAVLLADNQLRISRSNRRTTERLLYSTLVSFREAGNDADHVGYTYDVSGGGIYIRTTAMPVGDRVWLEIVPPGSIKRVRLEGRVAWRTPVTRSGRSPLPVGFGVQITDGSKASMSAWLDGYQSLRARIDGEPEGQQKPARSSLSPALDAAAPEFDPRELPTVRSRPKGGPREVWSSMSSGPSAAYSANGARSAAPS